MSMLLCEMSYGNAIPLNPVLIVIGEYPHPALRRFAGASGYEMVFLGELMLQAANKGVLRAQLHRLPGALDLLDSLLRLLERLGYCIGALLNLVDVAQALLHLDDLVAPDDIYGGPLELCVLQKLWLSAVVPHLCAYDA